MCITLTFTIFKNDTEVVILSSSFNIKPVLGKHSTDFVYIIYQMSSS